MTYTYFTSAQKEAASQTDLAMFLRSQGETLKRCGSEMEWKDGSQRVTIRRNLWYHQYDQEGGDAIAFVRRFYHKSYPEAVALLLGMEHSTMPKDGGFPEAEPKPLCLPERNDNSRRVLAYLIHRRGIDRDVVYDFVSRQMIYESERYHNAVFVGYDTKGVPRHGSLRGSGKGSDYKGSAPGSDPAFSFHWTGTDHVLYLFEAPIDLLSYISMHKAGWQEHSYAACCGVGDRVLWQMLKDDPKINCVCLCFDNDEAGQTAANRTADKLFLQGIQHKILIPERKDWNEDLISFRKGDISCQA